MSVLKRTNVKIQIGAIAGVAIMGFAAIALTFFVGHEFTVAHERERAVASLNSDQANALQEQIFRARSAEKDFFARKDLQYAEQHKDILAKAQDAIEQFSTEGASAEVEASIDSLADAVERYEALFQDIVHSWVLVGLSEKEGLRGKLRASVHKVEKTLGSFNQVHLANKMLMMRRHEKDFLLRGHYKYLDRIIIRESEFLDTLWKTGIPDFKKQEIQDQLVRYVSDFRKLANLQMKLRAQSAAMEEKIIAVDEPLEALIKEQHEASRKASESYDVLEGRAEITIYATIIVISLISIVLSTVIVRGITLPVSQMTGPC